MKQTLPLQFKQVKGKFLLLLTLFFSFSMYAQIAVDCSAGPVNTTYCYDNNDTTEFVFESSTSFPLTLTFNSGTTENNFDEVIVLDSDGVTNLNASMPYGNNGDLTGLTFNSSGTTITLRIESDGSNSCVSGGQTIWDFDVFCQTCINPTVAYSIDEDCEANNEFSINVDISDLGTATSLEVTDNQGSPAQTVTSPGVVIFGPYASLTDVIITVSNEDDPNCVVISSSMTFFCIEQGECNLVNAGEDVLLDCGEACADLEAAVLAFPDRETTSYSIQGPICDIPPVTGGTPTNLVIDDRWTSAIDLSFEFNYFNNTYDQIVIGANGQISFDTSLADQFNAWSIDPDEQLPQSGGSFPLNTIYGAFHDMNPAVNSDPARVNFFITGDAPYRMFVLNFNEVPHFGSSCQDTFSTTQQIILYETLNVIDVNLVNKPACLDWNDGLATLGLMGNDLTEFSSPITRNTGVWEAQNESWRFIPNGAPSADATFQWEDSAGVVLGTELELTVCPEVLPSTYTAVLIYEAPDGTITRITDDVVIDRDGVFFTVDLGGDQNLCDVATYDITATLSGADPGDATFDWSTGETTQTITVTSSGTYSVEVSVGGCTVTESVTITLAENPEIELGDDIESCFDQPIVLDATPTNYTAAESTFEWTQDGALIAGETDATLTVTTVGNYGVTVTVGNCSSQDNIVISLRDDLEVNLGPDFKTCANDMRVLTAATPEEGLTYEWFLNGDPIPNESNGTLEIQFDSNTVGTQTYEVVVTKDGCTGTDSVDISLYDIGNCVISEGLSPNGDGMNDCLDLEYIADRGSFTLEVFNRYGTSMYRQPNYIDQWCGQDKNGEILPSATYFYVIQFATPDPEFGANRTGWIYINKEEN